MPTASSDALTLVDIANLRDRTPREKETAMSMIRAGSIQNEIRTKTDARLEVRGREYVGVSTPSWIGHNGNPGSFKRTPRDWSEQTYQTGDVVDLSTRALKAERAEGRNPEGLLDEQVEQYLVGYTFDLRFRFFRNRHTGAAGTDKNTECFVGVLPRLRNPSKYRVNAQCNVNAGGLDLTPTGITGNACSRLIRYIQTAMFAVGEEDGNNCTAFASENLIAALEDGIRRMGAGAGFAMTENAYGKKVPTYRNMHIRSAGRQAPDGDLLQAQVLSEVEATDGSADTGGNCTSLVIVKTTEKDLYMTQAEDLKPSDPYKLEVGNQMRVFVGNAYGIVQRHQHCLSRVHGIRVLD